MPKSVEYSQESATPDNRVSLIAYPLIFAIYIYRYTLSPIFGNSCRYYPTCSHYAQDALRKHGALKGTWMAVKRIFRCHPWHEGGFDPVE